MFTGIVQDIGVIIAIQNHANNYTVSIRTKLNTERWQIGDSIAVNGICLTIVALEQDVFYVDIIPETLSNTSLKLCIPGSKVNLETACTAHSLLGGHLLSGHIDCVATIRESYMLKNAKYYKLELSKLELLQFCILKGSIAVDGTSLTIFGIEQQQILISLIPHTCGKSIIATKKSGDIVNIECDMLAKYIKHYTENFIKQSNNDS